MAKKKKKKKGKKEKKRKKNFRKHATLAAVSLEKVVVLINMPLILEHTKKVSCSLT